MNNEIIENLVGKLSCDFVMADPKEPGTLSGMLPILKQIHTVCVKQPLNGMSNDVLKAKKIINGILKNNDENVDQEMINLGELISQLSLPLQNRKEHKKHSDHESTRLTGRKDSMFDLYERLESLLERFSGLIGEFCPGEIPDLGSMLNSLEELIEMSKDMENTPFHGICIDCKTYVENMTLEGIYNTKPVEEGVVLLKSLLIYHKKGDAFEFDYSDVMELLEVNVKKEDALNSTVMDDQTLVSEAQIEPAAISEDDMEILADFISEAHENLNTIEVNLMDLEQDPSDTEIINDIFRPFHTIKGVSGFLSLTKINTLAHATENLLDGARSQDYLINHTATDVILESVDTLKKLIRRVDQGLENRVVQQDDDIDIDQLLHKLECLQVSLANGKKEPLGEILVRKGVVDKHSVNDSLKIQQSRPDKKLGEILVEEKKVRPDQVAAALKEQTLIQKKVDVQVKVSTQKLDDLVDYAGELVIAQSMLRQKTSHDPALSQSVGQLGQIVTNMQNIAMSMRMIPIKATFMKMIRLVRDLSRKSGKDVSLTMKGEDTEIDRNVVDALYEPMVHMIRNSVDHGIETEARRHEKGKPSKGNIILRAYHKGGHIIIEIEDDGKGLDKDKILEKAISSGLISGNEKLSDAQVYDLILQPGFSTADKITDVSGRGVGMDVVKSGIEKFRGQLNIDSSKDKGTRFTISLPLTLAIIDGMLVRVADERYVIPTMAIQKAFKPAIDEYYTIEGKGEMVKDRGSLIPIIRLNKIFQKGTRKKKVSDSLVVVVESKDEKRALLIDELLGKDEYVIKNLGSSFENTEGLAGGAILSDGRVGLILDIYGIFNLVSKQGSFL